MAARVLVIDDSPVTVQLITDALSASGISADAATDLASLDQRLSTNRYEVMLVDVNMPEMYGDDVVEFLRTQKRLTARLFLYSDLSEAELVTKTKASGADGFITKASGLEAAVRVVSSALSALPARRRALLIEAHPEALMSELAAAGFEVLTAASVAEATKVVLKKKTRPDLVLIDRDADRADELLRLIKSNSLFAHIRTVLLSAAPEPSPPQGADLTVPKGPHLAERLREALDAPRDR